MRDNDPISKIYAISGICRNLYNLVEFTGSGISGISGICTN